MNRKSQTAPHLALVIPDPAGSVRPAPRADEGPSLRILIVNYEFPPVGGGAGRASYNIARQLVRLGHTVDVLTSRYRDQPEYESLDGISVHRARSWRKGMLDCGVRGALTFLIFGFFQLRRLLNTHRYDLVHYFFSLPSGVLAFYSNGVRGLPYVVSLRGSDVPGYDESNATLRLLHRLLRYANRSICRRAARVVALSRDQRLHALCLGADLPMDVIPNGVDASRFAPAPHRDVPQRLKLICVSRLIDRKGLPHLFEAMVRLKDRDIHLTIAGDGPEESSLRGLARDFSIGDRVTFLGYVANEALRREYLEADVFVLPTLSEALGSVVLEAMSCGLPVVATCVGGIPEMIESGINGLLVPPGDAAGLADAIAQLAASPVRRKAMRTANLLRVAEEFTWGANAERYQSVYRNALAAAT